jgi:elongation factor G
MHVHVPGRENDERVARVFQVDANRKSRLDSAEAGRIVLLAGLRHATTGDTLTVRDNPVLLERIDAREPVLGLAIEPASSRDEEKMIDALGKMTEEDPTLRYEDDDETGQRILKGMGELHLQIAFERMEREFGLTVRVGRPRVVHRETVAKQATATGGVDRNIPSGPEVLSMKASCTATVTPIERGGGVEVIGDNPTWIPDDFTPSVEQVEAVAMGASDALSGGPIEGSPLVDVRVTVDSVRTFGPASSPQALRIAAATSVREALLKAGGLLMQPVMRVEVVVPDESTGTVLGDLQARGASILGHQAEGDITTIAAECGLAKLIGYATDLRSSTRGRGQFVMEFDRFDVL